MSGLFYFLPLIFNPLRRTGPDIIPVPHKRMKKSIDLEVSRKAVELGRWIGRRDAFALVAGRCAAAEVESLRRIRDSREYLLVCKSWEEFCTSFAHVTRRHVDRLLGYLKEFGPDFFTITQMTHVTVDEYRLLAPHVTENGLQWNGAPIALLPENSDKVAAGVAAILAQERAEPAAADAPSADVVIKRLAAAVEAFCAIEGPVHDNSLRNQYISAVVRAIKKGGGLGIPIELYI